MSPPLPFQSLSNAKFGEIYSTGERRLEFLGDGESSNEWSRALAISLRQTNKTKSLRSLQLLLSQPADIIYEIMSHLHPLDLYHLQTSTRHFRHVLSHDGSWVWSAAFQRTPDIPACPEGVTYMRWADLLFGAYICDFCGKGGAILNWYSRRRLCARCMADRHFYFLHRKDVELTTTNTTAATSDSSTSLHLCTIQEVADRLAAFQCTAPGDLTKGGLLRRLRQHPKTSLHVLGLEFAANICSSWAQNLISRARKQKERQLEVMVEWLKRRLAALGFHEEDIEAAAWGTHIYQDLTSLKSRHAFRTLRKSWRDHISEIESILAPLTRARLEEEETDRLGNRVMDIQLAYEEVQGLLAAPDLALLEHICPTPQELVLYEPVRTLAFSWEPIRDHEDNLILPKIVNYFTEYVQYFTIPRQTLGHLANQSSMIFLSSSCRQYEGVKLNSPAAVFDCSACIKLPLYWDRKGPLITWRKALDHIRNGCLGETLLSFKVNERGVLAGVAVMEALSLNPFSATVDEVKARAARFICLCCPAIIQLSMSMDWRNCIQHFVGFAGDIAHAQPSFGALPREMMLWDRDLLSVFMNDEDDL